MNLTIVSIHSMLICICPIFCFTFVDLSFAFVSLCCSLSGVGGSVFWFDASWATIRIIDWMGLMVWSFVHQTHTNIWSFSSGVVLCFCQRVTKLAYDGVVAWIYLLKRSQAWIFLFSYSLVHVDYYYFIDYFYLCSTWRQHRH